MPQIIKVSLQSRICYDSQASLSRFMFVYASLSILTMGIFPLSKNVMVPFIHGKKMLMEEKCLTEVTFWIRM